MLPSVRKQEAPGVPRIVWSSGLGATPVLPTDPRPRDLFLHALNAVSGTVALSADADAAGAEFRSAVAISAAALADPVADGAEFAVYVAPAGGRETLVFSRRLVADECSWPPFVVPLGAYVGQDMTPRWTSDGLDNLAQDWAMYRHPLIALGGATEMDHPTGGDRERPVGENGADRRRRSSG